MAHLAADLRFRGLVHQVTDPRASSSASTPADSPPTSASTRPPTASTSATCCSCATCGGSSWPGTGPSPWPAGGTGMIGDPGGKSGGAPAARPTRSSQANLAGIRRPARAVPRLLGGRRRPGPLLLDNADWLGPMSLIDFLRDVGKHFTVNQMVAKESVRARLERPDQGISYHRVQLHAAPGLRLPPPASTPTAAGSSSVAATSGATSPWASSWSARCAGQEVVRPDHAARAARPTGPSSARPSRAPSGSTPGATSPYQLLPVLPAHARTPWSAATCASSPSSTTTTIRGLDEATAAHPERREAQRALARAGVQPGARRATRPRAAEQAAAALFSEEIASLDEQPLLDVFAEAPVDHAGPFPSRRTAGVRWSTCWSSPGWSPSQSQARTTVEQGGAYVNNRTGRR